MKRTRSLQQSSPRSRPSSAAAPAWTALLVAGLGLAATARPSDPSPGNASVAPAVLPAPTVRYGRDIRPLLSDRCFQCHGTDSATRQAELRLDDRESATRDRGGFAAVVPGNVESSELWQRITSSDPELVMPPPDAKKRPLSAEDFERFASWIESGAEYEEHWAFVAPERPAVPPLDRTGESPAWARSPLDAFIFARLEHEGVAPSPAADPATLLRRLFLDATGLPPTVAELSAFLAAPDAEQAYAETVERLFREEPYRTRVAERLTTPWLDSARYADTIGIHTDNGQQMWPWRDWVLRAFRDNMPYDQFVTEQLAGDLLPDATPEQRVASGFNRNHVITDEGGAIADEYLVEYAVDRVSTTGAVFLGLTTGCARCHDHKFDPLTQRDFYSLFAYFNSIDEPGLYSQMPGNVNRAFEPSIEIPTDDQLARIDAIDAELAAVEQKLVGALPGEAQQRTAFVADQIERAGIRWDTPAVLAARSSDPRVALTPDATGAVQASGPEPDFEDYVLHLRSNAADARLLLIEALATPGAGPGCGRASHGNVVLSELKLEARPADGADEDWENVALTWAWADHTQRNRDYEITNAIDPGADGWAADGNANAGERNLLFLADAPFSLAADAAQATELRLTLSFRSPFAQHSMGRLRVRTAALGSTETLPATFGRWYAAGTFNGPEQPPALRAGYETAFGPELSDRLDRRQVFPGTGESNETVPWRYDPAFVDAEPVALDTPVGSTYLARTIWSPDARTLDVSLGSDDGFRLYLNGEPVAERRVDRGVAPDQDLSQLSLRPGPNALVLKITNTGGPGGYFFRADPSDEVLVDSLPGVLLPAESVGPEQNARLTEAWRRRFFEAYRELDDERTALNTERQATSNAFPRAMVMRERAERRPTYLLMRGQYDKPDETQPVGRGVPGFLPPLPADAPENRLGLAQWLVADEHPLFARVAVNRFWQLVFGTGLVSTSADFGLQGAWPSHPALLDWLAVDFRESGWDVHRLLQQIFLSSTYRQASIPRAELAERDPDNRLLAFYPRRRLAAEQLRDQALYVSNLLVEELGGASVKPYQPSGLWQEVAMLQSNTRSFEAATDTGLWRRSLYTYWKRAVPPPALQTFDAPTRESCVVRRQPTNTPLQALVLWNDEQFVEAARGLAGRVLSTLPGANDAERIDWLVRTCTGRSPEADEAELIGSALRDYRQRYAAAPEDARALLEVGTSAPAADATDLNAVVELGAWTLIASAVLNLHESLTVD